MSVPYLHEHDVNQSDSSPPLLTSSVPSSVVEVRTLTRLGKFARRRTCHLAPVSAKRQLRVRVVRRTHKLKTQ